MRLVKQPALWEGKFRIERSAGDLTDREVLQIAMGLMMVTLLEPKRG